RLARALPRRPASARHRRRRPKSRRGRCGLERLSRSLERVIRRNLRSHLRVPQRNRAVSDAMRRRRLDLNGANDQIEGIGSMRMRRIFLALSCLLCAACGPEFAVVPRGGVDRVVAQGQGPANGVTMVAYANQWDAYPYDLANYVTPIAVELYNPGPN